MPRTELTTLDATLDAATAIVNTHLAALGGPHERRRALQRACVVLCATAWETYAEDSLIWVAERAGASAARPDGPAPPGTPHLAALVDAAPAALDDAFTRTRWRENKQKPGDPAGAAAFEGSRADDKAWLTEKIDGPWPELLELDLRRRVLGLHRWDGPGRYTHDAMGQPAFATVARYQEQIYGERFIEQVRLPGRRPDYVATWLDALVEVRNASVHRGETPAPLNTGGVRGWIEFVHDVAHELDRLILVWADQHLPLPDRP